MTQVKVLFATDEMIEQNGDLTAFAQQIPAGTGSMVFADGQQWMVLNVKEGKEGCLETVRSIAGEAARTLSCAKVESAEVSAKSLGRQFSGISGEEAAVAFTEGWYLGAYQFLTYKSDAEPFCTKLTIEGSAEQDTKTGELRAEAMSFSRDLMNELSDVLNPETYPERLREAFDGTDTSITVHDKAKLEEMKMNGVLTVARGSRYAPSFVEMTYSSNSEKPLIALVGKGVTFDTGGISLKSGKDLSDMRMDMGGSAAVAGAMKLLVDSGADVNVIALIPMVENTIDNTAVLPGEVIRYKNGHTVQVGNTDAEGRLILADALIRAGELNADYVVDIATLTGSIENALGSDIAGVFGDDELAHTLKRIGAENGDAVWPMPLVEAYDATLSSDYADFNNISSLSFAGSITAALFLRRFVSKDTRWLHVDMAGAMQKTSASGYYPKTATGYGARLLADYVSEISK
ncbi:putative cytosol aminopeptidase [Sporosarcina sp. NCCP-2716]|uniref:leucyl aminopeptidase family protein n=1 Tax=Sporosarcina sp. NCCP-2716 TaxID=2943679 RepID=UPI00203DA3E9|nr:leucyl aminopeptidase family protein [Sporosarcina sp. NCCP-2716]GKV69445.1 putative cytosol aminopeptidase [Sporosarcina sp. NCCP-2716]